MLTLFHQEMKVFTLPKIRCSSFPKVEAYSLAMRIQNETEEGVQDENSGIAHAWKEEECKGGTEGTDERPVEEVDRKAEIRECGNRLPREQSSDGLAFEASEDQHRGEQAAPEAIPDEIGRNFRQQAVHDRVDEMILSGALEVETEENEQGREDRADGSIGRLVHADFQLHEGIPASTICIW